MVNMLNPAQVGLLARIKGQDAEMKTKCLQQDSQLKGWLRVHFIKDTNKGRCGDTRVTQYSRGGSRRIWRSRDIQLHRESEGYLDPLSLMKHKYNKS